MIIQIYTYYDVQDNLAIARMGADHIGLACKGRQFQLRSNEKALLKDATADNVRKTFTKIKPPTKRVLLPLSREVDEILNMVRVIQPDIVHIAFLEEIDWLKQLKSDLNEISLMQAIYVGPKGPHHNNAVVQKTLEYESYVDYILLDTQVKGASGVTGILHDWTISKQVVDSCSKPVILAGGLSPTNVLEAIEKVNPWGVDACTQLDHHPGKKNLTKVRQFIETIRAWEKRIQ